MTLHPSTLPLASSLTLNNDLNRTSHTEVCAARDLFFGFGSITCAFCQRGLRATLSLASSLTLNNDLNRTSHTEVCAARDLFFGCGSITCAFCQRGLRATLSLASTSHTEHLICVYENTTYHTKNGRPHGLPLSFYSSDSDSASSELSASSAVPSAVSAAFSSKALPLSMSSSVFFFSFSASA